MSEFTLMRRGMLLFATVFAVPLCHSLARAEASSPDSFMRCSDIRDDKDRLGCFDAASKQFFISKTLSKTDGIPTTPKPTVKTYQEMELVDLKLDADKLRGEKVSVSGNLLVFANMAFIRHDPTDTSTLLIQTDKVPREQRRAMLERCTGLGCSATIQGTVAPILGQGGISADQIVIGTE